MYYAPRQDIGSESDRTQCEEALNSRYLHWLSSSIQHTAFLAIIKTQYFRRNKNNVRIFCCTTSWEHTVVIVGKNFISSLASNKISSLKSDLQFCVLNDKEINLVCLQIYVNVTYFIGFVSSWVMCCYWYNLLTILTE
jgi:hypothetical protein